MFLEDLERAATQFCGLSRDAPILVGVSGGADSLALMLGLNALGFELFVAHLDHALRPESPEEADFVKTLAVLFDIPFVYERVDVRGMAEEEGQSLEEAARKCRYQFLFKQARLHHAQAVAVAHHADDQVETVLMHIIRGAALPGLSGMAYRREMPVWDEKIPLVRPLLGIWREEIDAYVVGAGITPCNDLSNQDTTYFRNRLRHALIPELETYNPQIKQVLLRMAYVLSEENRFLTDLSEHTWKDCLISRSKERIELRRSVFLTLDKSLKRRIFRRAISFLQPDLRDVGFDVVERGLAFVLEPSESGKADLVARLNLVLVGDILILKKWDAALPDWGKPLLPTASFSSPLNPGDSITLTHGWQITAQLFPEVPDDMMKLVQKIDNDQIWLDFDKLGMPLVVRGREEGELWQPLGMEGHSQKVSDFFINKKIPAHLRDFWPLVCSGAQIAWVVGLRPSEAFRVTKGTQRILEIKLIRD